VTALPVSKRVAADGAAADLSEPAPLDPPTPEEAAGLLRAAAAGVMTDAADVDGAWNSAAACAGELDGLEALDSVLTQVVPGGLLSGLSWKRRRLRDQARRAVAASPSARAVRLAVAVLGAAGDRHDLAALAALGAHPALTLHVATALANLGLNLRDARLALLQLMHRTDGAGRVIVIDRLLMFVGEPTVRLALIRDALVGLAPEHAREVADAIYTSCNVEQGLRDPEASAELRAGARLVLQHRGGDEIDD
jgi:hypothetical protein